MTTQEMNRISAVNSIMLAFGVLKSDMQKATNLMDKAIDTDLLRIDTTISNAYRWGMIEKKEYQMYWNSYRKLDSEIWDIRFNDMEVSHGEEVKA